MPFMQTSNYPAEPHHKWGTGSTHLEVATAEEEVNLDSLGLLELAKRVVDDVQLPMHATLHRDLHGSARWGITSNT